MIKQDFQKMQKVKSGFLNRLIRSLGNIVSLICILLTPLFLFSTTSWALNNASLDGTYVIYEIVDALGVGTDSFDVLDLGKGEITFDGNGGYTENIPFKSYELERTRNEIFENIGTVEHEDWVYRYTYSTAYSASSDTESGTYSVQSDGTVTLTHGGETETGFVSADGITIIFGEVAYDSVHKWGDRNMTIGVKKAAVIKGDIDGSGIVDLTDAVMVLQVIAGIDPIQNVSKGADVDGNGKIGLEETIYSLQVASEMRSFNLQSSAFNDSNPIPSKYTCDSINVSPPLSWQFVPAGTQSFVLIMDDPDAPGGTWDHWIVYDIPASITSLPENTGASGDGNLPLGARHGTNSWNDNNTYYRGPCPPLGTGTHRYFFKLYSLSVEQLNPAGTSKAEIEVAMAGKILDQVEIMGTYAR